MAKSPQKNTINKSLGNVTPSEHRYPTTANSGYPNTTKEQGNDLKSTLVKMTEAFKRKCIYPLKIYRKIQLNR